MTRLLRLLTLVVVLLIPLAARAEEGKVVVLVAPDTANLVNRIRAELRALGFTVETRPAGAGPVDPGQLGDDARSSGAVAAVSVQRASKSVRIWVFDRVTGKTVMRDIEGTHGPDDVLAVKTTELLWASLMEIQRPGFQPAEVSAPPVVQELAVRTRRINQPPARFAFHPLLGAGVLSMGEMGVVANVMAGLDVGVGRTVHASVRIVAPLSRPKAEGPEGVSFQSFSLATLDLGLRWTSGDRRWNLGGAVVGGLLWMRADGLAAGAYTSGTDGVLCGVAGLRPSVAVHLSPLVALRLDATAFTAAPRPGIVFAGRQVARAPVANVDVSLMAEIAAW